MAPVPDAGGSDDGDGSVPPGSREAAEQLFIDNLAMIQRRIGIVARKHRFDADEAEEFAATVHLRLIEDDYVVLRKFRGQCSLSAYLAVVLERMCLDVRVAQWGKWRPSAESHRSGDVGLLLDRLTMRDGYTFDEACSILEINHGLPIDREALAGVFATLTCRSRRRPRMVVSDEELEAVPAIDGDADDLLLESEQSVVVRRAAHAMAAALGDMEARDRLIVQLHFVDGLTLASVARLIRIPQKPLYRRIKRLLCDLRTKIQAHGVRSADLLEALSTRDTELGDILGPVMGTRPFLELLEAGK